MDTTIRIHIYVARFWGGRWGEAGLIILGRGLVLFCWGWDEYLVLYIKWGMNTLFSWCVGHREAVELWGQEPGSCSLMRLTSSTRAHILGSQSHHSSGSVVSSTVFIQYIMGKPTVGYSA